MSQCVVFEIVTYAMIGYIFELPLNNYAISTLISLTSYDSKWWLIYVIDVHYNHAVLF